MASEWIVGVSGLPGVARVEYRWWNGEGDRALSKWFDMIQSLGTLYDMKKNQFYLTSLAELSWNSVSKNPRPSLGVQIQF